MAKSFYIVARMKQNMDALPVILLKGRLNVLSLVRKCAVPPDHLRSEISFSRTCNIPNLKSYILYISHCPCNASVVVRLHGWSIAYALKQKFAQCKFS